jgi:hypothetical protein
VVQTSDDGTKVVENKVEPKQFNATIAKIAGLPIEETFISPEGRPFTIANHGEVIEDLIA